MNGVKLFFLFLASLVLMQIALRGNLGSVLAAIIDASALKEGNPTNPNGNSPPSSGGNSGGPNPLDLLPLLPFLGISQTTNTNTGSSGGILSANQIKSIAQGAGFTGNALNVAVAIALAESGGDPRAINQDSNGTTDVGLWQINSVHRQYSRTQLMQPSYNAQAAYQISAGGYNWTPWTTFTNQRYLQFLNNAATV